ncbi:unnamed protein product [Adineta steineri]|uniref:Uncharacterized protein n=1 Tax=Adineta steineri TaxID=433720 RepID=A0A814T9D0_9BILA|nr:unnamed protein product [Adineta steineri]
MDNQRKFLKKFIESRLKDKGLQDIAFYLTNELHRIDTTPGPVTKEQHEKNNYEKKLLEMKQELLYNFFDYLQVSNQQ